VNPSGKLPVTFYRSDSQLPDYEDYSMKGRTYRYFSDALFPFGYGLSYTKFAVGDGRIAKQGDNFVLTVPVSNKGKRDGTEIVQVYVKDPADTEGPLRSLRAFQRIDVKAGKTAEAVLTLTPKTFELFDPKTNTMHTHSGRYEVFYGNSSHPEDLKRLEVNLE
jgi:beta-glucosidase